LFRNFWAGDSPGRNRNQEEINAAIQAIFFNLPIIAKVLLSEMGRLNYTLRVSKSSNSEKLRREKALQGGMRFDTLARFPKLSHNFDKFYCISD
jgi:hypothetical protein